MVGLTSISRSAIGLGGLHPQVAVCIANKPPLQEYETIAGYRAVHAGELKHIVDHTGNHWRKIFNVYAKLAFELDADAYPAWQQLRDSSLLQEASKYALIFSKPDFSWPLLHIVMGKGYAETLGLTNDVVWLDNSFAVNEQRRLIVCPYFDYRQLSNAKIAMLAQYIRSMRRIESA